MMMMLLRNSTLRMIAASATSLIAFALPLHAQQPTSPFSLDFGSGFMQGKTNGTTYAGTGLGLSSQLSWQSRVQSNSAWIVGLNATGFMKIGGGAACLLSGNNGINLQYTSNVPAPYRDCTPHFPNGGGFGLLGGTERRIGQTRAATRLAIGPMLYVSGIRQGSLGLQSRVDLTFRTFSRSQFVLWSQTGYAPALGRGNSMLFSIGVGFRARDFVNGMYRNNPGATDDCCPQAHKPSRIWPAIAKGIAR